MKLNKVLASVLDQPLLITPRKLEEIFAYIELRANGMPYDANGLKAEMVYSSLANYDEENDPLIDGVQVIPCVGTLVPRAGWMSSQSGMQSTQKLSEKIIAAGQNDKVRRIVLEIDSPGGHAAGTPEVAHHIRKVSQVKPIIAAGRNSVNSGAFWIASSCTTFCASPSTMVGSHGVFLVTQELVKAAEEQGVKFHIFSAGDVKTAGSPYKEMSARERASLEERVDQLYASFTAALAEYRNVSEEKVLKDFGQGASFLAAEAVERGMTDKVMLFEEVVDQERRKASGKVTSGYEPKFAAEANKMTFSTKVRAGLYARDLINDMECSDDLCAAALTAFCSGRAVDVPTDESEITKVLSSAGPKQEVVEGNPLTDLEVKKAVAAENMRVRNLRAKAELFGISDEIRDAAIDDPSVTIEEATMKWSENLANRETPISKPAPNQQGQISYGPAEGDKFVSAATECLIERVFAGRGDTEVLNGIGRSLRTASMIDVARASLRQHGVWVSGDAEQDATEFLKLGGTATRFLMSGGIDGPAGHPDLLSNLAGKILEKEWAQADIHYMRWMERLSDSVDFKPRSIIEMGVWAELDVLDDDEAYKEKDFDSGLVSWIQQSEYGNKVALTTKMIRNDDLGGYARQLASFPYATHRTLQRLALDLLCGNFNMVDGNPQFSTDADNQVATGGSPTDAQASEMRKLHRLQKNPGKEGEQIPIGVAPNICLAPANLEDAIGKVYGTHEQKVANTTNEKSTVVRTVEPIIDAYLDTYSSLAYYTFVAQDMYPGAFAYSFLQGQGPNGSNTTWFDNDTRKRYTAYKSAFAVCAKSRNGVVYNPGA